MKKHPENKQKKEILTEKEAFRMRTEALAGNVEVEDYKGSYHMVLVFNLALEQYAIETSLVNRLITVPELTEIPQTPAFIRGLFSFRGELFTLFDPALFFGIPTKKKLREKSILLTNSIGVEMGILVDDFIGIRQIRVDEIAENTHISNGKISEYIQWNLKDTLVVLDIRKLLNSKEILVEVSSA
jgi:purine-binding chemotaxis protein CheW